MLNSSRSRSLNFSGQLCRVQQLFCTVLKTREHKKTNLTQYSSCSLSSLASYSLEQAVQIVSDKSPRIYIKSMTIKPPLIKVSL